MLAFLRQIYIIANWAQNSEGWEEESDLMEKNAFTCKEDLDSLFIDINLMQKLKYVYKWHGSD